MKLPRFSLRELFLLVVIAAMGCGWWVEHRHSTSALIKAQAWKTRAGALEHVLRSNDWSVEWDIANEIVRVNRWDVHSTVNTDDFEPSADE